MSAEAAAEWAGSQQPVTGSSAGPCDRAASGRLAKHRHRDHERSVPTVCVSTDHGRIESICDLAKPRVKLLHEAAPTVPWQADADDGCDRPAGHGGDVAQVDGHCFATDPSRPGVRQDKTAA